MKIHETLSEALDTDFQKTEVAVPHPETPQLSEDVEQDFDKAKETLKDLIETGTEAVKDIHLIAQSTEEARSFEVLAKLIQSVGEAADRLQNVHLRKKKLKEPTGKLDRIMDGGNIQVDKAVFVGTSTELLTQMKKDKVLDE